jgi:putative SOS response-associated peptidase YedK
MMCGRFSRSSSREVIAQEFGVVQFVNVDPKPRYNGAPSQNVEAIIRDGDEKRLGPMKWGFTSTSTSPGIPTPINARAETIASSPMFRDAFRRHRCLVVADGFYEWQKNGKTKIPYSIHLRSGRPFGFAGIWSLNPADMGQKVGTCAIVTCEPNDLMAPIHSRMPVIFPSAVGDRWLDPSIPEAELRRMMVPLPANELEAYPVSTLVNSPANDSAECVRRIGE